MIKIQHLCFPAALCILFAATSAMALGIGAYIEAAGGEGYRKVRSSSLETTGGTATGYGFRAGLIFDTCVACDDVFSYRLKIGGGPHLRFRLRTPSSYKNTGQAPEIYS
jgi:hypothetical protein